MIASRSVYVAGPSSERARIKSFSLEAQRIGWGLTHLWWEEFEKLEAEGREESSLSPEELLLRADLDFEGIALSRLVVVLAPIPPHVTKNTWIELGYAFGLRRLTDSPKIWVVGEDPGSRFFSLKADRHFLTEGDCLLALASEGEVLW